MPYKGRRWTSHMRSNCWQKTEKIASGRIADWTDKYLKEDVSWYEIREAMASWLAERKTIRLWR